MHPAALFHWDGNLLHNLQPKAFERGNVHRRIRKQANAVNAQVRQYLPAQSDGPQNAPTSGACEPSRTRNSWCRISREVSSPFARFEPGIAAPPGSKR